MNSTTELLSLQTVADMYGMAYSSVYAAARMGRLETVTVKTGRHNMHLTTRGAADALWAHRRVPQQA